MLAEYVFRFCYFISYDSSDFVLLADDDPVRVHAHGSSAAVQLTFPVFQQPCTLRCTVPHSARLLQRQPAEQGHPRTGSQLPGRSDFFICITTFKHFD